MIVGGHVPMEVPGARREPPLRRGGRALRGEVLRDTALDYHSIRWPLPKSFGKEKYAYSLVYMEDPRYIRECAAMSKQLIRLQYDQQIVDLEWRKTYKALLDAEHRLATLFE